MANEMAFSDLDIVRHSFVNPDPKVKLRILFFSSIISRFCWEFRTKRNDRNHGHSCRLGERAFFFNKQPCLPLKAALVFTVMLMDRCSMTSASSPAALLLVGIYARYVILPEHAQFGELLRLHQEGSLANRAFLIWELPKAGQGNDERKKMETRSEATFHLYQFCGHGAIQSLGCYKTGLEARRQFLLFYIGKLLQVEDHASATDEQLFRTWLNAVDAYLPAEAGFLLMQDARSLTEAADSDVTPEERTLEQSTKDNVPGPTQANDDDTQLCQQFVACFRDAWHQNLDCLSRPESRIDDEQEEVAGFLLITPHGTMYRDYRNAHFYTFCDTKRTNFVLWKTAHREATFAVVYPSLDSRFVMQNPAWRQLFLNVKHTPKEAWSMNDEYEHIPTSFRPYFPELFT